MSVPFTMPLLAPPDPGELLQAAQDTDTSVDATQVVTCSNLAHLFNALKAQGLLVETTDVPALAAQFAEGGAFVWYGHLNHRQLDTLDFLAEHYDDPTGMAEDDTPLAYSYALLPAGMEPLEVPMPRLSLQASGETAERLFGVARQVHVDLLTAEREALTLVNVRQTADGDGDGSERDPAAGVRDWADRPQHTEVVISGITFARDVARQLFEQDAPPDGGSVLWVQADMRLGLGEERASLPVVILAAFGPLVEPIIAYASAVHVPLLTSPTLKA
ncbi:hypothetical protein MF271_01130 (plasmid) [Deinococcus sp. KNUC1210]|uniref:hypothetical protein n=1 Tax=Deinococcus sp. KNUC1210 TaxID=2917691 RepID=UPI001EF01F9C|nr:hypothetical protein [Deinococcus sp. KNUC1210]ULH13963.1 hypothetical protein MF271_01130 [Deinococcus sp. KNUC1210]